MILNREFNQHGITSRSVAHTFHVCASIDRGGSLPAAPTGYRKIPVNSRLSDIQAPQVFLGTLSPRNYRSICNPTISAKRLGADGQGFVPSIHPLSLPLLDERHISLPFNFVGRLAQNVNMLRKRLTLPVYCGPVMSQPFALFMPPPLSRLLHVGQAPAVRRRSDLASCARASGTASLRCIYPRTRRVSGSDPRWCRSS